MHIKRTCVTLVTVLTMLATASQANAWTANGQPAGSGDHRYVVLVGTTTYYPGFSAEVNCHLVGGGETLPNDLLAIQETTTGDCHTVGGACEYGLQSIPGWGTATLEADGEAAPLVNMPSLGLLFTEPCRSVEAILTSLGQIEGGVHFIQGHKSGLNPSTIQGFYRAGPTGIIKLSLKVAGANDFELIQP